MYDGIQRDAGQRHLASRVTLHERAADSAAVADLSVTDVADYLRKQRHSFGEQLRPFHGGIAHEGTDDQAVPGDGNVVELVDLVDVDQGGWAPQSHVEHRHKALTTGEHPCRAIELVQEGDCFGDAAGAAIGKSGGFHGFWLVPGWVGPMPANRASTRSTADVGALTNGRAVR
jgi:hypothetical protein